MRDPALVSVIMPVFCGERFVAAAIESVLAQTYQSVELVIVNDGSTDASDSEIKRFLPHPSIRYVQQANSGVANARNSGIENASGAFIALLDQDDLWLPNKLELQVRYLIAYPAVGFVHSRVECIDAHGLARSCEGAIRVHPFAGSCATALLLGNGIAPLTVVMRAACIDSVGKFDQRFAPADDWEMWMRIARLYPVGFIDEVTARYRFHGQNISNDQLKMQRAVLKIIDAVCDRFPDIPRSVGAAGVADARYRALALAAQALEDRGRRSDARRFWAEAFRTAGNIEALLGLIGVPETQRGHSDRLLKAVPGFNRILTWYMYKVARSLWKNPKISDKDWG